MRCKQTVLSDRGCCCLQLELDVLSISPEGQNYPHNIFLLLVFCEVKCRALLRRVATCIAHYLGRCKCFSGVLWSLGPARLVKGSKALGPNRGCLHHRKELVSTELNRPPHCCAQCLKSSNCQTITHARYWRGECRK